MFVAFSVGGNGRLELEEDFSSLAMHLGFELLAIIPNYHPQVYTSILSKLPSVSIHNYTVHKETQLRANIEQRGDGTFQILH